MRALTRDTNCSWNIIIVLVIYCALHLNRQYHQMGKGGKKITKQQTVLLHHKEFK